jgi:hypothetical protein
MDANRAIHGAGQFRDLRGNDLGVEAKLEVGMRAGYDVRRSVLGREPQHGD